MKKQYLFGLPAFFALLSSCAQTSSFPLEAYVKEVHSDSSSLRVLQLSDIHWNMTTQVEEATAYLNNTIAVAKEKAGGTIDLIAITGDSLLVATKSLADRLYEVIDSWDIPFFVTYGNHDLQGLWSASWMNENVSSPKRKNSLFVNLQDNMHGESNYVLNWKKGDKTIWQIYSIDTGHYKAENAFQYSYDYIHEDQIEWFEKEASLAKGSEESYRPSLVFGHIGLPEITTVADMYQDEIKEADDTGNPALSKIDGENAYLGGYYHESNSPSRVNSGFFESAKNHGVRGMFFGHDHSDDAIFKYQGIVLGFGVKANTELYYTDGNIDEGKISVTGGALYTLKEDETFDIEHIYIDYDNPTNVQSWKREGL